MVFALLGCSSLVCSKQHRWDKVNVQVHNSLAPNKKLNIHCKSADDDLGFHQLSYNQKFSWQFHINWLESTLFWCRVGWRDNHGIYMEGSYNIYDYDRDAMRCDKIEWPSIYVPVHGLAYICEWHVQEDGLYIFHPYRKLRSERIFTWPKHLAIQNKTI
ncbi:hypothetical protein FRX31_010598 [Thalictrum thalictroides]|uniref:S-protein homolog n=1 Tax=Thalictrum thalictroides TaxID=46969 RepID=A0A7J6WS74_THATH|nr:hypothetical protein FRX31_010598 [Thalictrum thalictroides]